MSSSSSTDPDVHISPARTADLDAIVDHWVALAREQRAFGAAVYAAPNRETMRQILAAHQVDDGLLTARDPTRDTLLGFASFSVERGALELDTTRGLLSNLYVIPEARNHGIGTALLEAVETALTERGVETVILEAMAENEAAKRFYRRAGYDPFRVSFERQLADDQ